MTDRSISAEQAADAIRTVIRRRRGREVAVTPATELESLGLESQEVVEIFILLEDRTGCVVSTRGLEALRCVGDIAQLDCL